MVALGVRHNHGKIWISSINLILWFHHKIAFMITETWTCDIKKSDLRSHKIMIFDITNLIVWLSQIRVCDMYYKFNFTLSHILDAFFDFIISHVRAGSRIFGLGIQISWGGFDLCSLTNFSWNSPWKWNNLGSRGGSFEPPEPPLDPPLHVRSC